MAGASATRPAAPTQTAGRVSAKPIPAALVPAAVLLAVVVAVLSLLPSVAQAVWELPQLFLLGIVVSYGVFAQNHNKNAAAAAAGDAAADKDGGGAARAWSSRYHPDDPLVVVAEHGEDGDDCAGGRPFSLPVRRLKPVVEESEASGARSDDTAAIDEETASSSAASSTAGFWAGAPGAAAAPSPPSVLDAFDSRKYNNNAVAATPAQSTVSKGFPGYDDDSLSSLPRDDRSSFDDEAEEEDEGTDWDEDADGLMDDMTAASSERSFPGDFVACGNRVYNNGDGESVDEELLELAKKAGPEGEDEVDRKADEFIAKFREQIRLQRTL